MRVLPIAPLRAHGLNGQSRRASVVFKAFIIAALAWFIFSPVLHGGWLWDDNAEITANRLVRDPGGLSKIWFASDNLDYFPFTATVRWVQWRLWGWETTGYHLTNITLHVLGAFLFWRLLNKLGVGWAWWGALLFVVHPLTVESVAWIAELKNPLSLSFLLSALICYVNFDGAHAGPRLRDYFGALVLFTAAMLCKSSTAMFPAVLLCYAWWRRGQIAWRDFKAIAPFLAVSAILGSITIWFQSHRMQVTAGFPGAGLFERIVGAALAGGFYLIKCVCPSGLMPIYPRWTVAPFSFRPLLLWCLAAAMGAWLWGNRAAWGRHALFGLGWFTLNLVPVLGLVPMTYLRLSPVADHFAYLAILGIAGLASAAAGAGYDRLPAGSRPYALLVGGGLCVWLACQSRRYVRTFQGSEALWRYTVQANPDAWIAHYNLGVALQGDGRRSEAMMEYQRALALRSNYPEAANNLGNIFAEEGRWKEAIEQYERALRLQPDYAEASNNLGSALANDGRTSEAVAQFQRALLLEPNFAEAHDNLGAAWLHTPGRLQEAIAEFQRALRCKADYAEAHSNLGNAWLKTPGGENRAIAEYQAALRLRPDSAEVHYNLGNAFLKSGRMPDALGEYEHALRLRPDYAAAHFNLAAALLATPGRSAEAIQHLHAVLRLQPDNESAKQVLAEMQAPAH